MFEYPSTLNIIFDKLYKNKAKVIIVGGFIRDKILNIENKDIDIEVYNISTLEHLKELLDEFGNVNEVGKSFGVLKLYFEGYELDFSLPRIDNKIDLGYKGFETKIKPNINFELAASRRDFTINAIGYDVVTKKILDPYNGMDDLNNKILRAVNKNSFIEDPLRVLRAVQFCARFSLILDDHTFLLCKDMCNKDMLRELPKERIFTEIKKLLLKSKKPSTGFEILKQIDGLKYFHPLDFLNNDAFKITLSILDQVAKLKTTNEKTNIILLLSALCYNINKKDINHFLSILTNEKEIYKKVNNIIQYYKEIVNIYHKDSKNYYLYKLATKSSINELLIFNRAIHFALNPKSKEDKISDTIEKLASKLGILYERKASLLHGRDLINLGMKPSEKFSIYLNEAYDAQIRDKFKTYDEAKIWLKNYLLLIKEI
jgi:tRNA nucleotidyltransferase (CCA-adding enzyme)